MSVRKPQKRKEPALKPLKETPNPGRDFGWQAPNHALKDPHREKKMSARMIQTLKYDVVIQTDDVGWQIHKSLEGYPKP